MMRKCISCSKDITKRHFNAKRCEKCAKDLKRYPYHNLTTSQQRKALKLAGTMYRKDIAEKIGISNASLNRFAKDNKNVNWNFHKYDEKIVNEVITYYLNHTQYETSKKFPNVKVRSIVDRYLDSKSLKCRRWSDNEIVKLHKWTGLVPWHVMAAKLGRSTWSARRKRYKIISGRINSLPYNIAKRFTKPGCQYYYVKHNRQSTGLWIATWIDIKKHLKDQLPEWIKEAINALAEFQIWLHGSEKNIRKILEERL